MASEILDKSGPTDGAGPQDEVSKNGEQNDNSTPVPLQAKSFAKQVEDAKADMVAPSILGGGPIKPKPEGKASPKAKASPVSPAAPVERQPDGPVELPPDAPQSPPGPNGQEAKPDPFDLEGLVVSQNYQQVCGARKQVTIPIGKPNRQIFFRTHPSPAYARPFNVLEDKDSRQIYIVHVSMAAALADEMYLATIYTGITRQGNIFLWPARMPDENGRQMAWHDSAHQIAAAAQHNWVRIVADMHLGANVMIPAAIDLGQPEWPTTPYQEIIGASFKEEGIIRSPDHPAVRKLRGLI